MNPRWVLLWFVGLVIVVFLSHYIDKWLTKRDLAFEADYHPPVKDGAT